MNPICIIPIGTQKKLCSQMLDQYGSQMTAGCSFSYSASSDSNIATVNESGQVSGVAVGTCTVTITCGAITTTVDIIVYEPVATAISAVGV